MAGTKAPSGLSVARSGMKFTLSWKKADKDYDDGQQFQYRTNLDGKGVWHDGSIGADASAKTISLAAADYYPTTDKNLLRIAFRVRGKRAATTKDDVTTYYDWSAWTSKVYYLDAPRRPSLTATLDSTADNITLFEWDTETDSDDNRPTVNTEYQSMILHNCTETDGSKLRWSSSQPGWISATGALTGSRSITEDNVAVGSYTRWFRIRSRGPAGNSEWRYAKHVYAKPNQAVIKNVASAVADGNTTVRVEWATSSDASRPIDSSSVEYLIGTPLAGMTCPSGEGWTEAATVRDTSGLDAVRFIISGTLAEDECLWVRVVNKHDHDNAAHNVPSAPELVRAGRLLQPSQPTVTNIDSSNYTVTVTATNNSAVPDSKLAVVFRMSGKSWTIGVIDVHGGASGSVNLQCPVFKDATKIGFAVYAFQGTYTSQVTSRGTTLYSITENMRSIVSYDTASIPKAPSAISVSASKGLTEAIVKWRWTWADADQAEISWSDRKNAWESTEQPSTYIVENSGAAQWRVCGMEKGKTWYFRVRLGQTTDEGVVWGPYSEMEECGFYTIPAIPVLQLSESTVKAGGSFTASWTYSCDDGTKQAEARICAFPADDVPADLSTWDSQLTARVKSGQAVNISTKGWRKGVTYVVYVKVFSVGGEASVWSNPEGVHIPAPLECTIESTTLQTVSLPDGDGGTRSTRALTTLPLTVVVSGAPDGGQTTLMIEREDDYKMIRPDGTTLDGYAGEVVYLQKKAGGTVTFNVNKIDLIGRLDDGAKYILTAIVSGDNAISAQRRRHFEVFWNQKAIMPDEPEVELLEENAAKITPRVTTSRVCTCDIYRLSADRPELIVSDGTFGVPYVDPYPAIGDVGGYRIVYKAAAGDYITASGQPAWIDAATGLDEYSIIIDFNGKQAILPYDMSLQSRWAKSFTKTVYLGGSVQGDWNVNVDRTAAYTVDLLADDPEVALMRELADYTGICHIRTPEGSSYSCNIDVSENKAHSNWDLVTYTLSVTRIDPETLDGVTYEDWIS